jgi:hypothetical protein
MGRATIGHVWGVDSLERITKNLMNAVERATGTFPFFWGRYLGEHPKTRPDGTETGDQTGDSELKLGELDVLADRCAEIGVPIRFFCIYNSIFAHACEDPPGKALKPDPFERGKQDAVRALERARVRQVPDGTPIFANIEAGLKGQPRPISPDWLLGWSQVLKGKGGIYGDFNTPPSNPKFRTPTTNAMLGAAYKAARAKQPDFNPPLYAMFPHKRQVGPNFIDFDYTPDEPAGFKHTSVIWQYAVNWLRRIDPNTGEPGNGRFDTNLATEGAFDLMAKIAIGPGLGVDVANPDGEPPEPGTIALRTPVSRQPDSDLDDLTHFSTG